MVASVAGDEAPGEAERAPLLDSLAPDQLRTLAYASAIGREFDFRLLVGAMGAEEEPLSEQVERLTHLGILREKAGGDRFGFVEEELRARIYQSLNASRLRVLHRKIAEAMERQYPDAPPEIVPELGRHYFLGRVPEKSYHYNRRAATLALQDGAPEVAAHHLERARIDLRSLPENRVSDETELDLELGDLYYNLGDLRAADLLYLEGLERVGAEQPRLAARLMLARAEVARDSLKFEAAALGARKAHDLFSSTGDLAGIASVHRIVGRIAFQKGDYPTALDEGMKALDLVQQVNEQRLLGRVCIDLGDTFAKLGPEVHSEAVQWYERAIDRLTEVGDWVEVARAYLNLALSVGEHRPAEGLEHLARAREFAERAHETRWIGWSLAYGVELRLALGQIEEAERDNEQAGRIFERNEDPAGLYHVSVEAGLIAERRGQWEDAEADYLKALARAQKLQLDAGTADTQFHLARLWFKTRDLDRARQAYREAARLRLPLVKPSLAPAFHELGAELQVEPQMEETPDARPRATSRPTGRTD